MADTFGLKIGLEGEKKFKKALSDINQSFKVLGSEMKLVQSQFSKNDNSAEALAARTKTLTTQIDAQKQKIEMLQKALDNATESFGENDRRTQSWQIQLNNAKAALNDMERELDDCSLEADDMGEELEDAAEAAEESEKSFSGLGTVLKSVGAAMGTVVVAAGAATVNWLPESLSSSVSWSRTWVALLPSTVTMPTNSCRFLKKPTVPWVLPRVSIWPLPIRWALCSRAAA